MSKVYAVHQPMRREDSEWIPGIDLSPAEEFGELVVMLHIRSIPPIEPELTIPAIRDALADYQAEDFLVLVGDANLLIYAGAMILKKFGRIKMLKWHPPRQRYDVIDATMGGDGPNAMHKRTMPTPTEAVVTRKTPPARRVREL